jgi:Tol biopolymer transport system component
VVLRLIGAGAAVLAFACGGAPKEEAPPPEPSGANRHGHRGFVGGRSAEVPKLEDSRERIAYVRDGAIWMYTPGEGPQPITVREQQGGHHSPALSPDAAKLAYIAPKDGLDQLVVMDLGELVPQTITDGDFGQAGDPAWSPDGSEIAVMRGDFRDKRDLVLLRPSGGVPRVLVEGSDDQPEYGGAPAWAPDGKSIVFSADRRLGQGVLLWKVDTSTGTVTPLTRGRAGATHFRDRYPGYSPDGRSVVFASNRHVASADDANDEEIYLTDAVGKRIVRLSDGKGYSTDPAVSADGKRIYFTSNRGAQSKFEVAIYVMSIAGGNAGRLTRDQRPMNRSPSVARVKNPE